MARAATHYSCSQCRAPSVRWQGRCPKCGGFGTIEDAPADSTPPGARANHSARAPSKPARPVAEVAADGPAVRLATGIGEFDRVIGGGLVAGQVCLLSGAPGGGKSTLALAVADHMCRGGGRKALYVSGEESVSQVAIRARRIGAMNPGLLLADDTDLSVILGHVEAAGPQLALLVVDSVQTIAAAEVEGRAGGVTQVMAVTSVLTRVAKTRGLPVLLIGQVTKDSNVAGPRALEHIVDTTMTVDGDRHTSLRVLRTVKNRFGALEVAAFEQTDAGMCEVPDPSALFRGQRDSPVPGTCITVTIEGNRALIAEVQGLVATTPNPNPRRGCSGLDSSRAAMLLAVSERVAGLRLHDKDVFLATIGGMRLVDPAGDLAVCLSVISASRDVPLPLDVAAIGEVTLTGDIRSVPMLAQRVGEAIRLGYRRVLVPVGATSQVNGQARGGSLVEVPDLRAAIRAGLGGAPPGPG